MDKSCHSSGDYIGSSRDHYLKHLSKASHKISKPLRRGDLDHRISHPPPPQQTQSQSQSMEQEQQQQPPVYNINKSDFRDIVQKLTGSPANDRFSTPPPIQPPKRPSSRLQRIRPPPLAHLSIRPPPPLINNAVPLQFPSRAVVNLDNPIYTGSAAGVASASMTNSQRPVQPLSPLPPFPPVHAAAESPISAYMRFLQSSMSTVDFDSKRFSVVSPYPLLSPNMLFSPSTTAQLGFQQFPVSPTLPVPSPRWKDI